MVQLSASDLALFSREMAKLPEDMREFAYILNGSIRHENNTWEKLFIHLYNRSGDISDYQKLQNLVVEQYHQLVVAYNQAQGNEKNKYFSFFKDDEDKYRAVFYTGLRTTDHEDIYACLTENNRRSEINPSGRKYQFWVGIFWDEENNYLIRQALKQGLEAHAFVDTEEEKSVYTEADKKRLKDKRDEFIEHVPSALEDFSPLFQGNLEELAETASEENWGKNLIILRNYLINAYQKLAYDYNHAELDIRHRYIYFNDNRTLACINTGLFDDYNRVIFCIFKQNRKACLPKGEGRTGYYQVFEIAGFYSDEDPVLWHEDIIKDRIPRRPYFFNHTSDLVFDYRKDIVPNTEHILDDHIERLPKEIQLKNKSDQKYELDKAIEQAKERLQLNYKLAVPQYFPREHSIQLLLPLKLGNTTTENLALVIRYSKEDEVYYGVTCLPIAWAYGNARLIVKPDKEEWLQASSTIDDITTLAEMNIE